MPSVNKIILKFFCLAWLLFSINIYAEITQTYQSLLSKYEFKKDSYSLIVKNLTASSEAPIIHNGNKSFNPASLTKIITGFIALDKMGPNFKYHSDFSYTGKLVGDTLQGDLIFYGRGDASFSVDDLEKLIREIQEKGIKKLREILF